MKTLPLLASDTVFVVLESDPKKALLPLLYELEPQPNWHYLFTDTEWEPYQSESPIVVATTSGSEFLRHVMEHMPGQNNMRGLILESGGTLDSVVSWARQRLTVTFDNSRRGLLRFYDPLIWHELCSMNEPNSKVIARVHYWLEDNGSGQWYSMEEPEPMSGSGEPTLSPVQVQALSALASRRNNSQSQS